METANPNVVEWAATTTGSGLLVDPNFQAAPNSNGNGFIYFPDDDNNGWTLVPNQADVSTTDIIKSSVWDGAFTGTWTINYDFRDGFSGGDISVEGVGGGVAQMEVLDSGDGDRIRLDLNGSSLGPPTLSYPAVSAGDLEAITWSGSGTLSLGTQTFSEVFNVGTRSYAGGPGGSGTMQFTVVSVVPEPSSLLLGFLSTLMVFHRRVKTRPRFT